MAIAETKVHSLAFVFFTRVRIRVLTILMAVDDETDNVYNNNDYSGDNSDYVFTCEVSIMIIPI